MRTRPIALVAMVGSLVAWTPAALCQSDKVPSFVRAETARETEAASQKFASAMAALQRGENQLAADALRSVLSIQPDNGQAWSALGTALMNLDDLNGAIAALQKAEGLSPSNAFIRYNLACAEARADHPDKALQWLRGAVTAGFSAAAQLGSDPDLASIRNRPEFAQIVEGADINARPCAFDPRARQFDFWLGEWDVFDSQGRQVGTNRIESELNGCVLRENWTSGAGGLGQSINYYDVETDEWVQHWVDASGGHIQLRGSFRAGAMRLEGKNVTRGQATEPSRGIWTPLEDGRVRQLFEQSRDGGKTWYVWFDGIYVRKTESEPAAQE